MDIQQLKTARGGATPYVKPMTFRICGMSDVVKYNTANGEDKELLTLGLADKSGSIKGVLYDVSKKHTCAVGTTVMVKNYIIKTDPEPSIVLTKQSRVFKTADMEVPAEIATAALHITSPPTAEFVVMKAVSTSPVKSLVSVQGQVMSEEMERTVSRRGRDVPLRSIVVQDRTGSCKVTLWRENCAARTPIGSHLKLTNMVVDKYRDEVSLSTTIRSTFETTEAPEDRRRVKVIGFEMKEITIDLLCLEADEDMVLIIEHGLMASTLSADADSLEACLQQKINEDCQVVVKGDIVSEIVFA